MPITHGLAVAAATLVFAATSTVLAASNASQSCQAGAGPGTGSQTSRIVAATNPINERAAFGLGRLPWQAPIGHRQPRTSDVSIGTQLTPFESEQRRLDAELDRKLVICRGC